jgi:hypothetical protein
MPFYWTAAWLALLASGAAALSISDGFDSVDESEGSWPWSKSRRERREERQRAADEKAAKIQARRRNPPVQRNGAAGGDPHVFRQALKNFDDVQYNTDIMMNDQPITGIIDTGSYELVVFPEQCTTCGKAAKYNPHRSSKHKANTDVVVQSYGSGQLLTKNAKDQVQLGPFLIPEQDFWEVTYAVMPILNTAAFEAIIGVGPPDAAVNQSQMPTMLENMGMTKFSVCLGREPKSHGYFVWNDTALERHPASFVRVPVQGTQSWTVRLSQAQLLYNRVPIDVGCTTADCAGLVDSGTSLLMLPTTTVDRLMEAVNSLNPNCSNINDLPHLAFKLDGQLFTLPPDSYIAEVVDDSVNATNQLSAKAKANLMGFARIRTWQRPGYVCRLMVMEGNMRSQHGKGQAWILGMPFFRKYYTHFSLNEPGNQRALYMARANEDCTPQVDDAKLKLAHGRDQAIRRKIDPSKVLAPPRNWLVEDADKATIKLRDEDADTSTIKLRGDASGKI